MIKDSEKFLENCAGIVGSFERDTYFFNTENEIKDLHIYSHIEKLFYCAFNVIRQINFIDEDNVLKIDGIDVSIGLGIIPQYKIDKYRVDFFAFWRSEKTKEVIIECDSQEFHERTEQERRYEKMRDRFLQSKGYKVFRFTGKEIMEKPFEVAAEVISYLTGLKMEHLLDENYLG